MVRGDDTVNGTVFTPGMASPFLPVQSGTKEGAMPVVVVKKEKDIRRRCHKM